MNARRVAAAMAIPCLLILASEANAQNQNGARAGPPAAFDIRQLPASPADAVARLQPVDEPVRPASNGMLESWTVGANATFGIGRFRVGEIARPRTNTERMRENLMERENRSIAGAGLRINFD